MQNPIAKLWRGKVTHKFWKMSETGARNNFTRTLVTSLKVENGTYSHSFGLSANFIIWIELPVSFDMWDFVTGKLVADSVIDLSAFNNATVHVVDRNTGKEVCNTKTVCCCR